MAALQNGLCIRIALHEAVIGVESVLQGHSFSLWQRILLPKLTPITPKFHCYCSQSSLLLLSKLITIVPKPVQNGHNHSSIFIIL